MKKITTIIFALIVSANSYGQNFSKLNRAKISGTLIEVNSIVGTNGILFAGDNEKLYKSIDLGASWSVCVLDTNQMVLLPLMGVRQITYSPSKYLYILLDNNGTIYYSDTSTYYWRAIDYLSGGITSSISIINDSLYATDANGAGSSVSIYDIIMNNQGKVIPLTNFKTYQKAGNYYYTTKYNGTSTSLYRSIGNPYNGLDISANLPTTINFHGFTAIDDTLYFIDNGPTRIYKSIDFGNSWKLFANFSGQANNIFLSGYGKNLYGMMDVVGYYSSISHTSDNGNTWHYIYLHSSSNFLHVTIGDNLFVIADNSAGTSIYKIKDSIATKINVSIGSTPTPTNCNASFTLYPDTVVTHHWFINNTSSGVGPINYSWDWGDGTTNSTGANPSHTYADSGYYAISLTITDAKGCTSTAWDTSTYISRNSSGSSMISMTVIDKTTLTNGINKVEDKPKNISVYPNPTNNTLTINLQNAISNSASFKLFNTIGALVMSDKLIYQNTTLNIQNYPTGIYFLEVTDGGNTQRVKVIKN